MSQYPRKKVWIPEQWTHELVWQRCLKMLARRNWGSKELDHALGQKYCVPEDMRQDAIRRLLELQFIDDDVFAGQLLRMYQRRGYGPLRIKREMKKKYVPDELIHKYIGPVLEDQIENVISVAQKKWATLSDKIDIEKRRARLYRFLVARGFSSQAALSALQSL